MRAINHARSEAARIVVMTGGTSGIGQRVVANLLGGSSDRQIFLIARSSPRLARLHELPGAAARLALVHADLASLRSVDAACQKIIEALGSDRIDALVLNAGVQVVRGNAASSDALEISFAVNFLAHFLIVERLKTSLRSGARIIITTSEVHDPTAYCLMGIGRATWQDPSLLADPQLSQNHIQSVVDRGEARYCASKLLSLLYVRYLSRVLPNISVIGFNPSVVPGTEIGRDRNWFQRVAWKYLLPLLSPVLPGARSIRQSSSDLLWLINEADARRLSGEYVDGRVVRPGSQESRDEKKIARTVAVAQALLASVLTSELRPRPYVMETRMARGSSFSA
jgi:protochlorophyllide reductase